MKTFKEFMLESDELLEADSNKLNLKGDVAKALKAYVAEIQKYAYVKKNDSDDQDGLDRMAKLAKPKGEELIKALRTANPDQVVNMSQAEDYIQNGYKYSKKKPSVPSLSKQLQVFVNSDSASAKYN